MSVNLFLLSRLPPDLTAGACGTAASPGTSFWLCPRILVAASSTLSWVQRCCLQAELPCCNLPLLRAGVQPVTRLCF